MPKYLKIGSAIRFGLSDYGGPVIMSSEAIYLVLAFKPGGGLLVNLIQMGVDKLSRKSEISYLCDLSELPAEITADPDWPVKKNKGEVIVIPRADIKSLRLGSWLHSLLTIKTPERTFQAGVSIFKRRKLREFCTEHGWEMKE